VPDTYPANILLHLGRPAAWRVRSDDPIGTDLKTMPWRIVNPLAYGETLLGRDTFDDVNIKVIGVNGNSALVRSPVVVFSVADFRILGDLAQPETTGGLDGIGHFLETILPAWAKEFTITLRYLTKQAEIPTESGWAFSVGRQTPSPVSFPIPSDTNVRHVSKYELATAITQEADEERTKAIPVSSFFASGFDSRLSRA